MLRFAMEPLFVIFLFVAVMIYLQHRAKERQERMRILEEALRSGQLDEVTKAELVSELTGRRPQRTPASAAPWSMSGGARLLVGIGWIGMFVGVGMLLMGDRDAEEAGPVVALGSFALLSLPIAVREYERDRGAPRG